MNLHIDGTISSDSDIDEDYFMKLFIDWLESIGCGFNGIDYKEEKQNGSNN